MRFRLLVALATLAAIAVLAAPARALAAQVTSYVDCSAGADANPGTRARPWRSLAKANAATLHPGDALLLKRGCHWTGPLNVRWSGTAAAPITIGPWGTGNAPIIENAHDNVLVTGSHVIITSLATRTVPPGHDAACDNAPAGWRVGFRFYGPASFDTLTNASATGMFSGVLIDATAHDNRILHSTFIDNDMKSADPASDSGAIGIDVHGDHNEVAWNVIRGSDVCSRLYGRDGSAIDVFGGIGNTFHHNRTFDNNNFIEIGNARSADNVIAYNRDSSRLAIATWVVVHGTGSGYGPTSHTRVYNNSTVLTGTQSYGVVCVGSGSCDATALSLHDNIIWSQGTIGHSNRPFDEGHNIFWRSGGKPVIYFPVSASSHAVDPKLVDPLTGNLHLQASSPAIDAGDTRAAALGFTTSLDGHPITGAPDIGAHER